MLKLSTAALAALALACAWAPAAAAYEFCGDRYCPTAEARPQPAARGAGRAARHRTDRREAAALETRGRASLGETGSGAGTVRSGKTGATASVATGARAAFQAYVDDLEARGSRVKFMGGFRRGACSSASQHPCGTALDVCQTRRGVVDPACRLPPRRELARIAHAHGLYEGGEWCHSDYGHAQAAPSAAPCGTNLYAKIADWKKHRRLARADGSARSH